MAANILEGLKKLLNRVVDIVTQGNFDRVRILGEFNRVFNRYNPTLTIIN